MNKGLCCSTPPYRHYHQDRSTSKKNNSISLKLGPPLTLWMRLPPENDSAHKLGLALEYEKRRPTPGLRGPLEKIFRSRLALIIPMQKNKRSIWSLDWQNTAYIYVYMYISRRLLFHRTSKSDFLCSWPSRNSYLK